MGYFLRTDQPEPHKSVGTFSGLPPVPQTEPHPSDAWCLRFASKLKEIWPQVPDETCQSLAREQWKNLASVGGAMPKPELIAKEFTDMMASFKEDPKEAWCVCFVARLQERFPHVADEVAKALAFEVLAMEVKRAEEAGKPLRSPMDAANAVEINQPPPTE